MKRTLLAAVTAALLVPSLAPGAAGAASAQRESSPRLVVEDPAGDVTVNDTDAKWTRSIDLSKVTYQVRAKSKQGGPTEDSLVVTVRFKKELGRTNDIRDHHGYPPQKMRTRVVADGRTYVVIASKFNIGVYRIKAGQRRVVNSSGSVGWRPGGAGDLSVEVPMSTFRSSTIDRARTTMVLGASRSEDTSKAAVGPLKVRTS